MQAPRLSIIPAGAVTDPRLEGRDLQVLCLLGRHIDKQGWCFRSQGEMATELNCSRSTVQRSLARLVEAAWVSISTRSGNYSGRPYASYAYRVIFDHDDPDIGPSEFEVDAQMADEGAHGCTPLPTGAQGVPAQDGHRCPPIRGHITPFSNEESGGGGTRAREGLSSEAAEITLEIENLAGVDTAKDAPWFIAGPVLTVQRYLDAGYQRWQLIEGVKRGMVRRTGPPRTINYFCPLWARVRGEAESPALPAEQGATDARRGEADRNGHRQSQGRIPRPGSREDTREQTVLATRRLREFIRSSAQSAAQTDEQIGSGGAGGSPPAQLPKPQRA